MKKWSRILCAAAALMLIAGCQPQAVAPTPAPAPPVAAPATTQVFHATIDPVNKSGVHGEATVTVSGSSLIVEISASGLVPNQAHAQHIHGLADSQPSTCPPAASGVTLEPAAEKYYGQVLVPLSPFPTASAAGDAVYSATVTDQSVVSTISVLPLDGRAIVMHGMMVNGTYNPGVPVGCGELSAVAGQ